MTRTSSVVAALTLLCGASQLMAQAHDISVSGQTVLGILDTDQDGMPDPPNDCSFKANILGTAFMVDGTQGNTGLQLQGCGDFMGTAGANGSIELNFTSSAHVPGFVQLPAVVDLFHGGAGGGGAGGAPPVALPVNRLEIELGGSEDAGGLLCSLGGPVVQIRTTDGTTVVAALEFFPNASNPQYLKAPNIPISNSIGQRVLVDGYIPVTPDRKIIVTIEGVDDPVVEIDLDHLDPCGGLAVPTTTEWGLIALMLGLLAAGVWMLRGRPGFANGLAMF
jgi:hypothetical protein